MSKKVPASKIPERYYERFKYRLEEISGEYAERNMMLFYLGVGTGYRTQDIVDLTVGEIVEALENEKFIIQEKKQYRAWLKHIQNNPSSKRKQPKKREVVIKAKLKKMLKIYIKNKKKSEYAFPSHKGNGNIHISAKSYSNILTKVGKELGLKNISGHSMRKTYAHRLWDEKPSLTFVRDNLGHTSVAATEKYLGLYGEIKEDAAEITDDKL